MDQPYRLFGSFLLRRARWSLPLARCPNGNPDHRSCSELKSRPQPKSGASAESRPGPLFGSATHAAIHRNGIQ